MLTRTRIDMDIGPNGKFTRREWSLPDLKRIVSKWQNLMYKHSGWNAIFSENHDQPRAVSRWASDLPAHRTFAAKLLATWLSCLGGTLYIYQGQELGMRNVPQEWPIEEYKDIETRNYWAE
jgi:glycosidase